MGPKVQTIRKSISLLVVQTVTSNSFEVLERLEYEEIKIGEVVCEHVAIMDGGGNSFGDHG